MRAHAERLGLEPNAVRTMALAHVGYATAIYDQEREANARVDEGRVGVVPAEAGQQREESEELEERRMVAASGLATGASLYAIMYPRLSRMLFRAAARSYDELGLEYAAILGLCGQDTETVQRWWGRQREGFRREDEGGSTAARLLMATALALEDPDATDAAARVFEHSAQVRGLPIGSAGIPTSIYRDWAAELLRVGRGEATVSELVSVPRFFESFEERIEAVRANDVQWRRLNSAILPVEPEILAAALTVVRASRLGDRDWETLVRGRLSEVARIPLEIADEMEADESPSGEEREIIAGSDALAMLWRRFA